MSKNLQSPAENQIPNQKSSREQNEEYFEKVKAIYRGKTYRDKSTRNSSHPKSNVSSRNASNLNALEELSQNANEIDKKNNQYLIQTNQQASPLINSRFMTQGKGSSPAKIRYFPNKVQKERSFHTNVENDRMLKRIYEIKYRQNKYIKESQKLTQFSNEHKIMHQSSVVANRKMLQRQIEQKNDKFVDRLVERVKYKQNIRPPGSEKTAKCVRLDESRARVAMGSKGCTVQLPPMVFQ